MAGATPGRLRAATRLLGLTLLLPACGADFLWVDTMGKNPELVTTTTTLETTTTTGVALPPPPPKPQGQAGVATPAGPAAEAADPAVHPAGGHARPRAG